MHGGQDLPLFRGLHHGSVVRIGACQAHDAFENAQARHGLEFRQAGLHPLIFVIRGVSPSPQEVSTNTDHHGRRLKFITREDIFSRVPFGSISQGAVANCVNCDVLRPIELTKMLNGPLHGWT